MKFGRNQSGEKMKKSNSKTKKSQKSESSKESIPKKKSTTKKSKPKKSVGRVGILTRLKNHKINRLQKRLKKLSLVTD